MAFLSHPNRHGDLFTVVGVTEVMAHILSPLIFNNVYRLSVVKMPNFVFFEIMLFFAIACLVSQLLPNMEDDLVEPTEESAYRKLDPRSAQIVYDREQVNPFIIEEALNEEGPSSPLIGESQTDS